MNHRFILTNTLAALSIVTLVACKSDTEKWVEYEEQKADIVAKDSSDCAKMGKDLKAWDDSTKDDRKKLEEKMKGMSEADQKAAVQKYAERLAKAEEKAKDMQKCVTDSAVMDFYMKGGH